MLKVEDAAREASGDSRDRRREQVTPKMITGEPEHVQGPTLDLGQGRTVQGQDELKMTADGTEVDHNKWDIDDQNKDTKARTVDGGSEDGCRERGNVVTTGGEPDAGNDEDKIGRVDA